MTNERPLTRRSNAVLCDRIAMETEINPKLKRATNILSSEFSSLVCSTEEIHRKLTMLSLLNEKLYGWYFSTHIIIEHFLFTVIGVKMAGLDRTDPATPLTPPFNFPFTHKHTHLTPLLYNSRHLYFCMSYNSGMILSNSEKYRCLLKCHSDTLIC